MIKSNIILTGFMGCGKSSVGREVAALTGKIFLETDALIVERFGMPISEIFEKYGQDRFRQEEHELLKELQTEHGGAGDMVLSTGGGIVLNPANVEILKSTGPVIYLDVDRDVIWERVKQDTTRPLLLTEDPRANFDRLFDYRKSIYESSADMALELGDENVNTVASMCVASLTKAGF